MQQVPFPFIIKLCHITNTVFQSTGCEGDSTRRNTVHNPCSSLISTTLQHVQTLRALATQSAEEGGHCCASSPQLEFALNSVTDGSYGHRLVVTRPGHRWREQECRGHLRSNTLYTLHTLAQSLMYQTRHDYPCPNSALALCSGSWVAAGSLNPLET